MAIKSVLLHGVVVLTAVACLTMTACGKKGHCARCGNDNECDSGECATFITSNGDRHLLCGDGSANDTCDVPR